jgi:hypothetical protein
VLLLVCSVVRTETQGEYRIYLPAVIVPPMDGTMGIWSYVEPTAIESYIHNSSFEYATWNQGWANTGTNPPASADETGAGNARFGVHSAEVTFAGANSIFAQDLIADKAALDSQQMTISAWVKTTGTDVRLVMQADNSSGTASSAFHSGGGDWERLSVTLTPNFDDGGVTTFILVGIVSQTNLVVAYLDAYQLELQATATTYCDGSLEGCEFLGEAHNSNSARSALSRAGGVVTDFQDLNFEISGMIGAGMSPITLNVDRYAILPGGELNSTKTQPRTFSLVGVITGTSRANMQANREALIEAIAPNSVPEQQPIRIRYTGATLTKEIFAYYQAGLEGVINAELDCWELRFVMRFVATSPNFFEIGNSAAVLDTADTATFRYVAGRLRATEQWDNLGVAANPTVNGTIWAVLYNPTDQRTYYGGDFQGFDNNAGWDYLVAFNHATQAFERVGPGGSISSIVYALARAPNGDVYVGGNFLNLGGAAGDYVSIYDVSADAFTPLSGGGTGTVFAITVGLNGDVFLGGSFLNWNAIANADYMVLFDLSAGAYVALGTGGAGGTEVDGLATNPLTGDVVSVGNFTSMGGVANTDSIALWDISAGAWVSLSSAIAGGTTRIFQAAYDSVGLLYVVGSFTSLDGVAANYTSSYNGQAWSPLGSGLGNDGYDVTVAPDDLVYIVGPFNTAGDIPVGSIAGWNGTTWFPPDIENWGVLPIIRAVDTGPADPVVSSNYNIWIGNNQSTTADYGGIVTATNDGTEDAFPRIVISRSGGTTARLKSIRNETMGLVLWFNYDLLDGETLTIELAPTDKNITSNFFGQRLDAVLANSDFGTWRLQPGTNQVTAFVDVTGAPTIVGTLEWADQYWSAD